MYWLANSGTNRSATAMMPAAAYSAAIASPSSSSTPSERRNGGISSRQKARNGAPVLDAHAQAEQREVGRLPRHGGHGSGNEQADA